ncbi:MAG: type II toxin-antitoxin system RelE/ParE family toxin [Burkholderiales bacterium]|nr:type II toxin-antitoxin system RelE/ParE family toxin [Burkholderiales bacterium]
MPNYYLSEAAKEDLIRIAQYGNEYFGVTQSDHYRDQLKRRFLIIAERPLFFPAVDHIRVGYRRSVCGAHSIYYRIEGDSIEIIRIIGRQDVDKNL